MNTVPSAMLISENDRRSGRFALGLRVRVRLSASVDQFDRPWGSNVTAMRGRIERYVGDLDAPDQQRQEPQLRDQPLGGERRLGAAIVAERRPGRD